jgi:hypothetical protein
MLLAPNLGRLELPFYMFITRLHYFIDIFFYHLIFYLFYQDFIVFKNNNNIHKFKQ